MSVRDLQKFSDEDLRTELRRRRDEKQARYVVPVVESSFGDRLELDLYTMKQNVYEEHDDYDVAEPDCVIVMTNKGGGGLNPCMLLLPGQLYTSTVDNILGRDTEVWVTPAWSRAHLKVTK